MAADCAGGLAPSPFEGGGEEMRCVVPTCGRRNECGSVKE